MKNRSFVVTDVSSILGAYLHIKDEEFGDDITYKGEKFHIPSTEYCMEKFRETLANADWYPRDMILVRDPGGKPRARIKMFPDYKNKPRTSPPEFHERRTEFFAEACDWLRSLGAIECEPKNYTEADDLINELVKRLPNVTVWSRDKDMLATGGNVLLQGKGGVEINPDMFPVKSHTQIHCYRAIVQGDSSDNLASCKGFGPKAWEKMIDAYGLEVIEELDECLRTNNCDLLKQFVDEFKPFKLLVDQWKEVELVYRLMNFLPVPAHMVKWRGGMECGTSTLVGASNFDEVLEELENTDFDYSVIDYEADTCQASRDWCEKSGVFVDVLGQEITGMGLRIHNKNWYFTVDHSEEDALILNVGSDEDKAAWKQELFDRTDVEHCGDLISKMANVEVEIEKDDSGELREQLENLKIDLEDAQKAALQVKKKMKITYPVMMPDGVVEVPAGEFPLSLKPETKGHFAADIKGTSSRLFKGVKNITIEQLEQVLGILWGKRLYAHNLSFENTLTYNHFEAMMPNAWDTAIMAAYVDENESAALKTNSKRWLGYNQTSYNATVGNRAGMRDLTASEVVDYGIDDVITTDGLKRLWEVIMTYEDTLHVFEQVEVDALYHTTMCFINGVNLDQEKYDELKETNDRNTEEGWEALNESLLELGWEGAVFKPVKALGAAVVTKVYNTIYDTDEVFSTAAAAKAFMGPDHPLCIAINDRDFDKINAMYKEKWVPKAEFNTRSPTQMSKLMYDVMGLKIRIRNKPTENMKKAGKKGNPAANEEAINNAIAWKDGKPEHMKVLEALIEYKGFLTKESLFLSKYPKFVHWKTGRVHASLRQSSTTTGRFSCKEPNLQQLPKRKGKEFRSMLVADEGYLLVALDFTGQELRIAADDSQDENFISCYIGKDLKDPHSLTGLKICNKLRRNRNEEIDRLENLSEELPEGWTVQNEITYQEYRDMLEVKDDEAKSSRSKGKSVNFGANYGAMAPRVAFALCITTDEAQTYLDSRAEAFPDLIKRVAEWHDICRGVKYATTMLGRRRHLHGPIMYGSKDEYRWGDADRLAYSMRIQGSAAEMTKIVMGEMYKRDLLSFNSDKGKVKPFTVVHDEVVFQVRADVVHEMVPVLVEIMCQQYGDMMVPMETEPEIGKHFGELNDYNPEFDYSTRT